MSREDPQMKIRLPADLKDQIEAVAKQSGRSMNAEIVARLEGSFDATAGGVDAEAFIKELEFVRHAYAQQVKSLSFGQELLANFLLAAAEGLPDEVIESHHFASALAFAQGIASKDVNKIAEGYAGLFPELQGNQVIKKVEEMGAKHKQGEDMTPYLQEHLDETRKKWEAKK